MDGLLFIWISWIFIIIYAFFSSSSSRSSFICHLLIVIFLSQYAVPFGELDINITIFYMMTITCYYMAKATFMRQIYIIFAAFIMALCRASYELLFSLEPLWFLWVASWCIFIIFTYLAVILIKPNQERMMCLIMGMVISDVLIFIVHQQSALLYSMFSLNWLDQVAIVLCMLFVWKKVEELGKYFSEPNKYSHKKEV